MSEPLGVKMGMECAVHKHRELVPLERHHIWPLGKGGPDHPSNIIVVCENGHGSIHSLLDQFLRYGKDGVPWTVQRNYGRKVRILALLGYKQIMEKKQ